MLVEKKLGIAKIKVLKSLSMRIYFSLSVTKALQLTESLLNQFSGPVPIIFIHTEKKNTYA